ncbi:hypothetical protein ABPG72_008072 [Tetrahymena utriculariae]
MGQIASQLCNQKRKSSEKTDDIKQSLPPPPPPSNNGVSKSQLTYNDFEIIKSLGQGAYGNVYQVQKKTSNKQFAMKAIKKSKLLQNGMDLQMLMEKNVLLKNKHPFLVTLKYSFQSDKKLYLVMDLCKGGELLGYISQLNRLGISQEVAKFIGAEVLLGLEYLHKKLKIMYRDLKPENILVCEDGHIKIADFGLSKHFQSENEKCTTVCGTLEYLAPEIIQSLQPGFQGYGIEVDIWAFGIFLFEIITGQPPFTHPKRNTEIIMKKVLQNKVQFPSQMKEESKDIIMKCLQNNPKDRPTWDQLKNHPFFLSINWEDLYKKQVISPILKHIPKRQETKKIARPIIETQTDEMYRSIKDFYYAPLSLVNQNSNQS